MNPFNEFQPNVIFAMQLDIVAWNLHMNDSIKKKENKKKRKNNGEENISSSKDQKKHRSNKKSYPGTPKFTYYIELIDSRENVLMATEDHVPYKRKAKERGGTIDSTGILVMI
ncbi:hypothetical protein PanWU01x14_061270 [Parasponia andersonii]|uniref:Uncharacterized protein n=1 Tax=Parasponia andersonii TaxID=3476 RepID=A0A2P5DI34_PARAD|nr:hypothetical protein PanWU01x14_061270 [Parasponia andersonii]